MSQTAQESSGLLSHRTQAVFATISFLILMLFGITHTFNIFQTIISPERGQSEIFLIDPEVLDSLREAIASIGSLCFLIFVVMCILSYRAVKTVRYAPIKLMPKLWVLMALSILVLVGILNLLVDPMNLYSSELFETRLSNRVNTKLDAYEALTERPDVLFLGSSRSTRVRPSYLLERLGYSGFNLAIPASSLSNSSLLQRRKTNEPK